MAEQKESEKFFGCLNGGVNGCALIVIGIVVLAIFGMVISSC